MFAVVACHYPGGFVEYGTYKGDRYLGNYGIEQFRGGTHYLPLNRITVLPPEEAWAKRCEVFSEIWEDNKLIWKKDAQS